MCENVNPRVIVDDDFLDLRNVQSKPFSKRPLSAHSISKRSSSVNTQGQASTVKEVLPGLQRFLNTYNKKKSYPFGYKKNNPSNVQTVDCRFRRKVEKKTAASKSESIFQENEENTKETASHSSNASSHNNSSESEKRVECHEPPERSHTEVRKTDKTTRSIYPSKIKEANAGIETKTKESIEKPNIIENECKKCIEITKNHVQNEVGKNIEMKENKLEGNIIRRKCNIINQGEIQLENLQFEDSCGFYPLPTFKKSWTVPSLPLIKNKFSWTRHYNALCAKVDRKTYEFDTDGTASDSEDHISAYSSISRSNYMNLIFCLGCLCGIFLIGGILTASEIHADYFRPLESEEGMLEFFYGVFSNTFRLILSVFQQILTLPSTKLFRTDVQPTNQWSVLTKCLYFLPE